MQTGTITLSTTLQAVTGAQAPNRAIFLTADVPFQFGDAASFTGGAEVKAVELTNRNWDFTTPLYVRVASGSGTLGYTII